VLYLGNLVSWSFNRPPVGLGWNAQTDSLLVQGHIQTKDMGRAFQAQEVLSREVGSELGP
jgi:hypothetical protein